LISGVGRYYTIWWQCWRLWQHSPKSPRETQTWNQWTINWGVCELLLYQSQC